MIFKRDLVKNSVEISKNILKGEILVNPNWPTTIIENINWTEDPFEDSTWCFYFQSLTPVSYLMMAFESSQDQSYLLKAQELVESWIIANPSPDNQSSPHAWKDHSTANRVVNLVHFWDSYVKSSLYDKHFANLFLGSIERHGDFLADDDNYSASTNHGIFQDRSLLEIAVIFPEFSKSNQWYEIAERRLSVHIKNGVTYEGFHKEHSAAYHIVVMNLFRKITDFLKHHNRPSEFLDETVYKMEGVLAHISQPNGRIPMTGDSGPDTLTPFTKVNIINPNLKYVVTNGRHGEKPSDDIVYPVGGAAVFRDSDTYLFFTAAFHSRTHKHADDLSFLLSKRNTEFFVDSGKYNYREADEHRKYFRSTLAHNCITINRKSYGLTNKQVGKSKITSYEINDQYCVVSGEHTLYAGAKVMRTVVFLKDYSSILIFDRVEAPKQQFYTQTFNIGKDVDVTVVSKKNIHLESKLDNSSIELIQLNPVTEFKHFEGSDDPIAGWQSQAFNKKHPINQLLFTNKGIGIEYRTILNMDSDTSVKTFNVNGNSVTFTLKTNQKETVHLEG